MTAADDDLPRALADVDRFAVVDAPIAVGQRMDVLAEVAEARVIAVDRRRAPAGAPVELGGVRRGFTSGVGHRDAAVQVFEPRHPQPAAEPAGQPAGHADMVRVHVGDEDARDRTVAQAVQQLAPCGGAVVGAYPGVDDGAAIAIVDQPDVDVVELERQRHAHPAHARPHLQRLTCRWRRFEWVVDRWSVHCTTPPCTKRLSERSRAEHHTGDSEQPDGQ